MLITRQNSKVINNVMVLKLYLTSVPLQIAQSHILRDHLYQILLISMSASRLLSCRCSSCQSSPNLLILSPRGHPKVSSSPWDSVVSKYPDQRCRRFSPAISMPCEASCMPSLSWAHNNLDSICACSSLHSPPPSNP